MTLRLGPAFARLGELRDIYVLRLPLMVSWSGHSASALPTLGSKVVPVQHAQPHWSVRSPTENRSSFEDRMFTGLAEGSKDTRREGVIGVTVERTIA